MVSDVAREYARAVDARVLASVPPLPSTPAGLYDSIRTALMDASNDRLIASGPHDVARLLRPKHHRLPRHGFVQIDGGTDAEPFIRMSDGAAFNFGVTVEYRAPGGARLVSFRYQLQYRRDASPPFLRFDLNPCPHVDPVREPQSHIHPGHDDIRCPFPLMAPLEMMGFLIHGCRMP